MSEKQKAGPTPETGLPENICTSQGTPSEADLFGAARGYCVVVRTDHGKFRRRLYLSLNAAEKAVERARAHGKYASMVLAVIVPTGVAE